MIYHNGICVEGRVEESMVVMVIVVVVVIVMENYN